MNKEAQIGIGALMITFIAVLVGVILFTAIAQEAGSSTTLSAIVNETVAAPANGATVYMDYRLLGGTISISNATAGSGEVIDSGNYTITNNAIDPADGTLSVGITVDTTTYQSMNWNVSSTEVQPQTYIASSSARSVTGLIAIFFALAIAVIALEPTLRSGVLTAFGK